MHDVTTDYPWTETVPGPIHRAIDLDTAVQATLHRLGRLLHEGDPVTADHCDIVAELEDRTRRLGACLLAIRDGPRPGS
jgi:hypothetical protein